MDFEIKDCQAGDPEAIEAGLIRYNVSKVPQTQEEPLILVHKKIVDAQNRLIGGCLACIYCWRIMYVDILWIDEAYRKQRLGSTLLAEMERVARENNCTLMHLDTFDFQAKDFYLKHGFELFGTLEDCPEGHCRYYLKKKLR